MTKRLIYAQCLPAYSTSTSSLISREEVRYQELPLPHLAGLRSCHRDNQTRFPTLSFLAFVRILIIVDCIIQRSRLSFSSRTGILVVVLDIFSERISNV